MGLHTAGHRTSIRLRACSSHRARHYHQRACQQQTVKNRVRGSRGDARVPARQMRAQPRQGRPAKTSRNGSPADRPGYMRRAPRGIRSRPQPRSRRRTSSMHIQEARLGNMHLKARLLITCTRHNSTRTHPPVRMATHSNTSTLQRRQTTHFTTAAGSGTCRRNINAQTHHRPAVSYSRSCHGTATIHAPPQLLSCPLIIHKRSTTDLAAMTSRQETRSGGLSEGGRVFYI